MANAEALLHVHQTARHGVIACKAFVSIESKSLDTHTSFETLNLRESAVPSELPVSNHRLGDLLPRFRTDCVPESVRTSWGLMTCG